MIKKLADVRAHKSEAYAYEAILSALMPDGKVSFPIR